MVDKLASLEITVLSAEDLSLSRRPIKKNAFVTVRTDPHNHASTNLDADGGSFPRWNERLCLALPRSAGSISVEVRCKAGPDVRVLGRASIPVSDFCGGVLPADYLHFLSYRLRDRQGDRNGIINLSIRAHNPQPPALGPPPPPVPLSVLPPFSWGACRPDGAVAGVAMGIPAPDRYKSAVGLQMATNNRIMGSNCY